MEEPDVFYPDCDLIYELKEYVYCIECYRYETCKEAWQREQGNITKGA